MAGSGQNVRPDPFGLGGVASSDSSIIGTWVFQFALLCLCSSVWHVQSHSLLSSSYPYLVRSEQSPSPPQQSIQILKIRFGVLPQAKREVVDDHGKISPEMHSGFSSSPFGVRFHWTFLRRIRGMQRSSQFGAACSQEWS